MMRSGALLATVAALFLAVGLGHCADEVILAAPAAVEPIQLPVGPVPVIEERPWPVFAQVDYLLWWVRPAPVPLPLVVTPSGPADLSAPVADRSNVPTQVLFGNTSLSPGAFSGLRLRVGLAPTDSGEPGVELGGLVLPRTSVREAFSTPGNAPNGLLVPFPDLSRNPTGMSALVVGGVVRERLVAGRVDIANATEVWGASMAASTRVLARDDLRLDLSAGFRHFFLSDTLTLLTSSGNGSESYSTFDRFLTRNYFYGALGGARLAWASERFEARVRFDLALGVTAENLRVGGLTVRPQSAIRTRPGPAVVNGGLFSISALGINREARFAALTELGVDVGYRLTDAVTLRLGYDFLCLSAVRRAGDQIGSPIDPRALPVSGGNFASPPTPAPVDRSTYATLHGIHLGMEIAF